MTVLAVSAGLSLRGPSVQPLTVPLAIVLGPMADKGSPLDPILANHHAAVIQQGSHPAIAITAMFRGQVDNVPGQLILVGLQGWNVSLRPPGLPDDPAGAAFGEQYRKIVDDLCDVAVRAATVDTETQLALRELIHTVRVTTIPEVAIRVSGRLSALTGTDFGPVGGLGLVAGVRANGTSPLPVFEFQHWQLAA